MLARLLAGVISLLLVFGSATTVAAKPDAAGFLHSDIEWPVKLTDARVYILEGNAIEAGECRYEFSETHVSQDDIWYYTRVIGVDSDGCRLLIEEGTSTEPPTLPSGDQYAHMTATAPEIKEASDINPAAVGGRKRAVHTVQWVDPAGIAVNWVRNTTTWTYDYTCAGNGSTVGAWDWFWESGWYRTSWSVSQSQAANCEWWQGQSKATYRNDTFCNMETTKAVYDYVRVKGWFDGTVTTSRSTYVTGPCRDLLHMEHSTSVTSL